jgi:carbamoyl-phosphate synthase large subunit
VDLSAPALDDCDQAILLPRTNDPAFVQTITEICRQHEVDLVLPGRDPDVVALAEPAADPRSTIAMPCAPPHLVAIARDKWLSALWCNSHGIAFADSVSTDDSNAAAQVGDLLRRWGYPLIAKPRDGSASAGVVVVVDDQQLTNVLSRPGVVLQPFIDPPSAEQLSLDGAAGWPLFWEIPCPDEPAIMGLIGPDGEIGPHLCFTATHRLGRNEDLCRADDPELDEFARLTIEQFRDAGWRGPLNMQVRRSPDSWYIIEINARFTGGTAGRLHLGLDEVRWVLHRWLGREVMPAWNHPPVRRVNRYLQEFPVRRLSIG